MRHSNSLKPIATLIKSSQETLTGYSTTQTQTSTPYYKEIEAQATVYFFKRLKDVYGAQFKRQFTSDSDLLTCQKEWQSEIGKLTREQIDKGIDKLKQVMQNNNEFHWPNIARTIGLCRTKPTPAAHKTAKLSAPIELSEQQRKERSQDIKKMLHKIKRQAYKKKENPNLIEKI